MYGGQKRKRSWSYKGNQAKRPKYSSSYRSSSAKGRGRYSSKGGRVAGPIINRGPSILPDSYYTKLQFNFTAAWSSASGPLAAYAVFKATAGDPTGSLGSARPIGALELDSLYERWNVLGSKVRLTISHEQFTTGNASSVHVLIPVPHGGNGYAGVDTTRASSAPYAKSAIVNAYETKTISTYISNAKLYGITKSKIKDDPNWGGAGVTDPSFFSSWIVGAQGTQGVTSGTYNIKMTLYMRYFDRVAIT